MRGSHFWSFSYTPLPLTVLVSYCYITNNPQICDKIAFSLHHDFCDWGGTVTGGWSWGCAVRAWSGLGPAGRPLLTFCALRASPQLHNLPGGFVVCEGTELLATEVTGLHLRHTRLVTNVSSIAQSKRREIRPLVWWGNGKVLEENKRQEVLLQAALGKYNYLHCSGLVPRGSDGLCELTQSLFLIFFSLEGHQSPGLWHAIGTLPGTLAMMYNEVYLKILG